MNKTKRRYVYDFTVEEVVKFANDYGIRAPNNKENFPHFLHCYILFLKGSNKEVWEK